MSRYFEYFPKILYDVNKNDLSNYKVVTNILSRVGFIRDILNNASAYTLYIIKESDRPEILADKMYGDPEAHWLILYANNILDPQYDWPMDSKTFSKHIKDKYGSIEAAKTGVHHYEKVIERLNSTTNTTTTKRIKVDKNAYYVLSLEDANGTLSTANVIVGQNSSANGYIVYDAGSNTYTVLANNNLVFETGEEVYITPANVTANIATVNDTALNTGAEDYFFDDLSVTQSVNTYEVSGDTITETIYRQAVSYYDYEDELNESKRLIKIVKNEYYEQILSEFKNLMKFTPEIIRTVR
jgi:predicted DNA-binding protein YlxM (UPF0122 family)